MNKQATLPKKKKNYTNLIMSGLGLFFFAVAAYMIYKQMSEYSFSQVRDAVASIPTQNILIASVFVFLSYMVLTLYDFLALNYIGRKSLRPRWILAGFSGFAVSNNAGHALISGTAVRYHLYKRWGFSGPDILKMVTFSTFTYTLGCFLLLIIGFMLAPEHGRMIGGNISPLLIRALVVLSVIILTTYICGCIFVKKQLNIGRFTLEFPSIKLGISQLIVGTTDVLLASCVLYSVLHASLDISFGTFIGVFLVAQVLGTFSQVPGGVGVFESIFFFVLADKENQEMPLIAALIVYRILYYLLPLLIAFLSILSYELRYQQGRKRILKKFIETTQLFIHKKK